MKRVHGLFLALAAGGACKAQEWDFSEDSGAPSADATAQANAADGAANVTYGPGSGEASVGRCASEGDCVRAGLHCLVAPGSTGECVACVDSSECLSATLPRCDPTLNRCVECDTSADCLPGDVCMVESAHSCIPSCATQGCPPTARYCDLLRNVCLSCTSSAECRIGQVCEPTTGRCGECAVDADCRRRPFFRCDRTNLKCVECLRSSDCGRGLCSPLGFCFGADGLRWWDE